MKTIKKIILAICILASSLLCLNAETINNNTETVAKKAFELLDFSKIKVEGEISKLLDQKNPIRPKKGMLFVHRRIPKWDNTEDIPNEKISIGKAVDNGVFVGNYDQRTVFIETDEMYADGDSLLYGIYECVGMQDTNRGRLYKLQQYNPMSILGEENKENCLDLNSDKISSYMKDKKGMPNAAEYFEPMDKVIDRAYRGELKALEFLAAFFDDRVLMYNGAGKQFFFWTFLLGENTEVGYWNLKLYYAKLQMGLIPSDPKTIKLESIKKLINWSTRLPTHLPLELKQSADNGNIEAQILCGFFDPVYREMARENKRSDNDFSNEHSLDTVDSLRNMIAMSKQDFIENRIESFFLYPTRTGDSCYDSVVVDLDKINSYIEAAKQGDSEAQYQLGRCYLLGIDVPKDDSKAIEYAKESATQGNASGQNLLGVIYLRNKDFNEAVIWLRKAAAQEHATAQVRLGLCYLNGDGVSKNPNEGVKWLKKAVAQENVDAQFYLGHCYFKGFGVSRNREEAYMLIETAAKQGNRNAISFLKIYKR